MTNPRTWVYLLRVPQWSKNAVVFAALVFGDPQVQDALWRSVVAFVAFCLVSSSGYIVNDVVDVNRDRMHPTKRRRPIASGAISTRTGLVVAVVALGLGLGISLTVNALLALVLVGYAALSVAYSFWLKNFVLLDALVIATGFLLRAVAGAAAVEVPVSPWLMLCTVLLALFLAFGKRRSELMRLHDDAESHRASLGAYSRLSLDNVLVATAVLTIIAYSFYSITSESVPQSGVMVLTVPFVAFAILRYSQLVLGRGEGGSPETLLWKDRPLLASVVGWAAVVLVIMYAVD